jgi:hypothetical protein
MDEAMKTCTVCGESFTPGEQRSPFEEAGEWLAAEL